MQGDVAGTLAQILGSNRLRNQLARRPRRTLREDGGFSDEQVDDLLSGDGRRLIRLICVPADQRPVVG